MANGIPVVQPRHGAFPEIIEKTGGGLLVEPDDPQSFADGLMRIFENPTEAESMGRLGAEGVRLHYNVTLMAERTMEAYERVISGEMSYVAR